MVFSFIFLLFFWPSMSLQTDRLLGVRAWAGVLGPGELHILGLCLQGTRSMKVVGKFGLQLSAMLNIMVDP